MSRHPVSAFHANAQLLDVHEVLHLLAALIDLVDFSSARDMLYLLLTRWIIFFVQIFAYLLHALQILEVAIHAVRHGAGALLGREHDRDILLHLFDFTEIQSYFVVDGFCVAYWNIAVDDFLNAFHGWAWWIMLARPDGLCLSALLDDFGINIANAEATQRLPVRFYFIDLFIKVLLKLGMVFVRIVLFLLLEGATVSGLQVD